MTARIVERITDRGFDPGHNTHACESDVLSSHALFIVPTRRGGFEAHIQGHVFELSNPADDQLAPSPDDLLVASIASDLAWSARTFLRASGLSDDVSVSAKWRATGPPSLAGIDLTVMVSTRAEAASGALAAVFANSVAARSLGEPVIHISSEG